MEMDKKLNYRRRVFKKKKANALDTLDYSSHLTAPVKVRFSKDQARLNIIKNQVADYSEVDTYHSTPNVTLAIPKSTFTDQRVIIRGQKSPKSFDFKTFNMKKAASKLTLVDFDSKKVEIKRPPRLASASLSGQSLLKPLVETKYKRIQISESTCQEFNIKPLATTEVDHVHKNIQLAQKFRASKDVMIKFKRSVLSKNNGTNLKLIKQQIEDDEKKYHKLQKQKLNKWNDFRERKAKIIDQYLYQKRKCRASADILKQIALIQILRTAKQNQDILKHIRETKLLKQVKGIYIALRWRRKVKRYGGEGALEFRYQNSIRQCFTVVQHIMRHKAVQVVKDYFLTKCGNLALKQTLLDFHEKMRKLQKKIRDIVATRYSKIEVMRSFWDKTIGVLLSKASVNKDKQVTEMVQKISLVCRHKQNRVFKQYIQKCKDLHSIAFMQWRLKYKSENKEMLKQCIESRIDNFRNNTINVREEKPLPGHFYCRYGLKHQKELFLVDTLESIYEGISGSSIDLQRETVYHSSRYFESNSPSMIYIPTKSVMLQLMRSTITQ